MSANHSASLTLVRGLMSISVGLCMSFGTLFADERVEEILATERSAVAADRETQLQIDHLAEETQEAVHEYRLRLQELEQSRRYNANLQRTIDDQEREKRSLVQQIDEFGDLERGIVPLLIDMVDDLERFIALDLPFRVQDRIANIQRLRDLMDRSDVTIAERYGQVMRAYQDEVAVGRNIETYSGELDIDGVVHKVDFFRVGRVLFAYQTPDREQLGFWDTQERQWRTLDDRYRRSIDLGIRIARNLAAPDILELPIAAPQESE